MENLELNEFVRFRESEGVGIKSAMTEWSALERGYTVTRHTSRVVVINKYGQQPVPFREMNGPSSSSGGKYICDAKETAREYLREAGLQATPSSMFHKSLRDEAWQYAQSTGGPVVIKPTSLARGRGISLNVTTEEQFDTAWKRAIRAYGRLQRTHNILVEEQATGNDYRIFVTTGPSPVILATMRRRARVLGDGERSVRRLIRRKNRRRARNPYLAAHPIPDNIGALDLLTQAGHDLDYTPRKGEKVTLRSVSNLSAGGDSVDYTERIHPGFKDIAIRSVEAIPGMNYAGIDIISPNITISPTTDNHVIGEVEYSPAPITHFPVIGAPRDMAGAIVDHYLG